MTPASWSRCGRKHRPGRRPGSGGRASQCDGVVPRPWRRKGRRLHHRASADRSVRRWDVRRERLRGSHGHPHARHPGGRSPGRHARPGQSRGAPLREARQRELQADGRRVRDRSEDGDGSALPRPELYGQPFADTNLARFGDPSANVWTLHAWVWKPNPGGMFDPWNTRVTC